MTDHSTARALVEKLEPCPFCGARGDGSLNGNLHYVCDKEGSRHRIKCTNCSAEGGRGNNNGEAAYEWNTRALTPPEGDTLVEELERRRLRTPQTEYGRGWNCGLEEAQDVVRARPSLQPEGDTLSDEAVEALTPSGDTKAAYSGEFKIPLVRIDENGDEYTERVYVPWDTIKEIMAAIRKRAALQSRVSPDAAVDPYAHRDGSRECRPVSRVSPETVTVDEALRLVDEAVDHAVSPQDGLREALEEAREAIATLDEDAFGHANMPDRWTGAAMAYSVRDELLAKIDAALSASRMSEL